VTDDTIEVVLLVPDIDAIIARGINVGNISTAKFADRFKSYVEAFGPINGRDVVVKTVVWNVLDPTDFDRACTRATVDNKPFVVVNGSGYRDSSIPCLAVENNTPYMTGDMVDGTVQKAAGKNIVALALPPEVAAKNAARLVDTTGQLPKTAKIGILSNNITAPKLAGDALEKELTKRGYDVVSKVEANGLVGDAAVLRRDTGQAAVTFQANGVDTVFDVMSTNPLPAFFDEARRVDYKPAMFLVDGQSTTCTINAAARFTVRDAEGMTCITYFDGKAGLDGKGVREDTEFEAECRETYEAKAGFKTSPNGPSAGVTVNGVKYEEDIPNNECMLANLLLPAMKKAGKNLTWNKVHKNIMAVTDGPTAYMSDGKGGFGPKRPYYATDMHFMEFRFVDASTPQSADGNYNGCPIPVPCWVPVTVDGKEWFATK
jgi:hypothetical protein